MIALSWVPTIATLMFLQVSGDHSVRPERGFAPFETIQVAMNRVDDNEVQRPTGEQKVERKASKGKKNADLPPTRENVKYGPHERNAFDIWLAPSKEPTPLLVFIHGGGFINGDKGSIRGKKVIRECLSRGVSFASINYRFRTQAPIQEILRDAARSIQYLRSHAKEWNIDPTRIAAFGGSAGAGTSLWLAVHDDLADPNADDPVLRESSRLTAAGLLNGQASYDLRDWEAIVGPAPFQRSPKERLDFHGFASKEEMSSAEGDKIMKVIVHARTHFEGRSPHRRRMFLAGWRADGPRSLRTPPKTRHGHP
ncbi:MAG: alpha/beta hydrolase [Planctomycetota bacterium]